MLELADGMRYKISDDGKSILSCNVTNRHWTVSEIAPQGKTFTDIRKSATGNCAEFKCSDGKWYENRVGGGLKPTLEEQRKMDAAKRSESKSKKKGSLIWRIIKGTFKIFFGFILFAINFNSIDDK